MPPSLIDTAVLAGAEKRPAIGRALRNPTKHVAYTAISGFNVPNNRFPTNAMPIAPQARPPNNTAPGSGMAVPLINALSTRLVPPVATVTSEVSRTVISDLSVAAAPIAMAKDRAWGVRSR